MASFYKTDIRRLVGNIIDDTADMFKDWESGDAPVDCLKDAGPGRKFPYKSFPTATNILIVSKLSKEIKCTDGNTCPANFVDDTKRTLFQEMKKLILDIEYRLDDEDACKTNIVALKKPSFNEMSITEQEKILDEIEKNCFSAVHDMYKQWHGLFGTDGKCQAQLGGTYLTEGVSNIDGKCPGKFFLGHGNKSLIFY